MQLSWSRRLPKKITSRALIFDVERDGDDCVFPFDKESFGSDWVPANWLHHNEHQTGLNILYQKLSITVAIFFFFFIFRFNYKWSVYDHKQVNLANNPNFTATGITSENLAIRANKLSLNSFFNIVLDISYEGEEDSSTFEYRVKTSQSPQFGFCSV